MKAVHCLQGLRTADAQRGRLAGILEDARQPLAKRLNARFRSMRWAGAELGLLAFAANAVMVSTLSLKFRICLPAHLLWLLRC